jgi:hypothetical protein
LTWDIQQALLEGLAEDESVPFRYEATATQPFGAQGPRVRTNVQTGADVIDLTAMLDGLEAGRKPDGA